MEVQDVIDELKDVDGDETVLMEVENGKESIKDADRMKQVIHLMADYIHCSLCDRKDQFLP